MLVLIELLLVLISGIVIGVIWAYTFQKTVEAPKTRPVIHIRSNKPGVFVGQECARCAEERKRAPLAAIRHAEYVDELMVYWCAKHVPTGTRVLERAVAERDGHAEGRCLAHDFECPKPWAF